MHRVIVFVLLIAAIQLSSCTTRPQAPALRDDPVYQNDQEGFRFLAPEGWKQTMRGTLPPGTADKERSLVEYQRTSGEKPASMRVSRVDLPSDVDLSSYLTKPAYGIDKWQISGSPEEVKVGKLSGTRYVLTGQSGKQEFVREAVWIRHNNRGYFFTVMHDPKDTDIRQLLRKVVESVIWK